MLSKASARVDRTSKKLKGLAGTIPGLGRVSEVLGSLGAVSGPLIAVGAAIVSIKLAISGMRAVIGIVNEARTSLDALAKSASTFGIDPTALQAIRFAAAELSGMEDTAVDKAMEKFAKNVEEAATGVGESLRSFDQLGLSAERLSRLPLDVAFKKVAEAIADTADKQEQLFLATQLFGRSGGRLVNVLRQGPGILDEYIRKTAELGGAFTSAELGGVESFNDSLGRIETILGNLGKIFTVQIMPELNRMTDSLEQNKQLVNDLADAAIIFAEMMKQAAGWAEFVAKNFDRIAAFPAMLATMGTPLSAPLGFAPTAGRAAATSIPPSNLDSLRIRTQGAMLDARIREVQARSRSALNSPVDDMRSGMRQVVPQLFGPSQLARMLTDRKSKDDEAAARDRIEKGKRENDAMLQQLKVQKQMEQHLRGLDTAKIP